MQKNVGLVDQYLRLASGTIALVAATQIRRNRLAQTALTVYGSMKVAEGVTGWCPLMHAMGIRSTADGQSTSTAHSGNSGHSGHSAHSGHSEHSGEKSQAHAQSDGGHQKSAKSDSTVSSRHRSSTSDEAHDSRRPAKDSESDAEPINNTHQ